MEIKTNGLTLSYLCAIPLVLISQAALAQTDQHLSCQWQTNQDNDVLIQQQKICNNVSSLNETVNVASKVLLKQTNQCFVTADDGYRPQLAGKIIIEDTGYCDTGPVYFRPDPINRVVDGVEETLLSCAWQQISANDIAANEQYRCDNVDGSNIDMGIALRTRFLNNSVCQLSPLMNDSNNAIEGGQLMMDEPAKCEVGAVYFRPFAATRVVDGVIETLQHCQWQRVSQGGDFYTEQRMCDNINGSGIDKAVSIRYFNGVSLTNVSLIGGIAGAVVGGLLVADKAISGQTPPIYYHPLQ